VPHVPNTSIRIRAATHTTLPSIDYYNKARGKYASKTSQTFATLINSINTASMAQPHSHASKQTINNTKIRP
jgi:uncharacterized protein involved in propanediol utilization